MGGRAIGSRHGYPVGMRRQFRAAGASRPAAGAAHLRPRCSTPAPWSNCPAQPGRPGAFSVIYAGVSLFTLPWRKPPVDIVDSWRGIRHRPLVDSAMLRMPDKQPRTPTRSPICSHPPSIRFWPCCAWPRVAPWASPSPPPDQRLGPQRLHLLNATRALLAATLVPPPRRRSSGRGWPSA